MTNEQYLKNLELPVGVVDAVLDTDAYNEIDDQYAISLMMKSPEKFNVKALYAAPFFNCHSTSPEDGMVKSYEEIKNLLRLMGREDFIPNVFEGSRHFLKDENAPEESPAARDLVRLAKNYSPKNPLYVLAIGAITNVASALIMDPSIAENIVVVWLGGHAITWGDSKEFNLCNDVAAGRIVFKAGCPLVMLPCMGVVSAVTTTEYELKHWLGGKNALADYLVKHTVEEAEGYAKGKPWSRVIWDITTVLWFFNDGKLMRTKIIPAPMPEYDHHYSFSDDNKKICYVDYIDRDRAFEILFNKLG